MTEDYELTINYPPQDGEWLDGDLDDQIIDAVGQAPIGTGAGPLTGGRDLHFRFDDRLDAEHAVHRLKVLGDVDYRWAIDHWVADATGEIIDHRTLAMGSSKVKESSE